MEDGETLEFGGRVFTFLHTRGHANHHLCIFDSKTRGVFTGDAFGVDYKPSRPTKRPFLLCSTAPTDFDADAARASIERIVATGAERVYLTHFGELAAVKEGADVMIESINRMERILRDAIDAKLTGPALQAFCERRIHAAIEEQLAACGTVLEPGAWENLDVHNRINAQGLAYLAEKANG
jgi:glyoxylase-like metal-dependent hydrolase (beta-lactamase superfamily II)